MVLSPAERAEVKRGNLSGKRPSVRRRLNLQCKECIYDPEARGLGTWREQVGDCDDVTCPLWAFRPKPAKKTAKLAPSGA